jgi:hypothetical protein
LFAADAPLGWAIFYQERLRTRKPRPAPVNAIRGMATPLEFFFGLSFAAAVAQAGQQLVHGVATGVVPGARRSSE